MTQILEYPNSLKSQYSYNVRVVCRIHTKRWLDIVNLRIIISASLNRLQEIDKNEAAACGQFLLKRDLGNQIAAPEANMVPISLPLDCSTPDYQGIYCNC